MKRFVAWSSKHKGVAQNWAMAVWCSAGSPLSPAWSSDARGSDSKDLPEPVGFNCKKSPK